MAASETPPEGKPGVKTLAVRLDPALHVQLTLIAQLRGTTITDEIRSALTTHVAAAQESADLAAQADSVLAELERKTAEHRQAIAALVGTPKSSARTTRTDSGKRGT